MGLSFLNTAPARAVNPTCSSAMAAQSNITATPSHGQVMYIDSGVTPKIDAAYVGYKLLNTGSNSTANLSNIWVTLENFSGGKVVMANTADRYQQIETLNFGGTDTAFFLLKAYGATSNTQMHTLKIYDRRPDLVGANNLLACDFTFLKVAETLKTNANKINTITSSLSPSTATLGGTLTINITSAATGRVGAGSAPDGAAFWATPSGLSSWPVGSLRLETTTILLDCIAPNADITLTNSLFLTGSSLQTCVGAGNGRPWTASYKFRIIGPGPAALVPSPVAYVSNGTRYSHCDLGGITNNISLNLSTVVADATSITLAGEVVSTTTSNVTIKYTSVISTTSTSAIIVDEAIFRYQSGMNYVPGSTTLDGVTISDGVAELTGSPPPFHFVGPFSIVSGSPKTLTFKFTVPCSSTSTIYQSEILGYFGSVSFGSSSSSVPTSSTTTQSTATTCDSTTNNSTQLADPFVQTSAADNITSSAARLNGIVNAYSNTGCQYRFAYSTDSNVVVSRTNSSWTNFSGSTNALLTLSLSSLTPNTVYFFRVEIQCTSVSLMQGEILSFSTSAQQLAPSVTTAAAGPIATGSSSSTTLNGYVNPNLTDITSMTFIYCTSGASGCTNSAITTGTETSAITSEDGTGGSVTLTLTGSGTTPVSINVTSQSAGTTYFFKLRAYCTVNATYCPAGFVDGGVLSYTVGAPTVTTSQPTDIADTSALLNGTLTYTGTATWSFVICRAGTVGCSASSITSGTAVTGASATNTSSTAISSTATSLISGETYYYQTKAVDGAYTALGEILSFTTLNITTSSISFGVAGSSYSDGFQGIGGSQGYQWSTTDALPGTITISESGVISGISTEVGSFTITVKMLDVASLEFTTKQFTLVIKGTVTYFGNGATSGSEPIDSSSPYTLNSTVTVLGNTGTLSQSGYTFAGWNTQSNGTGTQYSSTNTFSMGSSNVELFAQWTIVQTQVNLIAPDVVLVDPRAKTLSLPEMVISGPASVMACYKEVSNHAGAALSGSTNFSFQEKSAVANVTAGNSVNARTHAGGVNGVQEQSGKFKLNSANPIAPGISRYIEIRVTSTEGGLSGSCNSGGASKIVEIRPYGIALKIFQPLTLGHL